MYYVNDGVYGSFNCILYDHAHVQPLLQKVGAAGSTCGSRCSVRAGVIRCFSLNTETQTG